jgi:hypothetical protein
MPRKRWRARLSEGPLIRCPDPKINPEACKAVTDHDLVRATLVDFKDEFAKLPALSNETHNQLVENLVDSGRAARAGAKARKSHVTDKACAQDIFMSGFARALERAGLPATRWRKTGKQRKQRRDLIPYAGSERPGKKHGNDRIESFYFRLARALAADFGLNLPQDLKRAGQRAAQVQYGVMTTAMETAQTAWKAAREKAAQDAKRAARRQRLIRAGDAAEKAAWQRCLGRRGRA